MDKIILKEKQDITFGKNHNITFDRECEMTGLKSNSTLWKEWLAFNERTFLTTYVECNFDIL